MGTLPRANVGASLMGLLYHIVENGAASDESITSSEDEMDDEDDDLDDEEDDVDDEQGDEGEKGKPREAVSWRKLPQVVTKHHKRYAPYTLVLY